MKHFFLILLFVATICCLPKKVLSQTIKKDTIPAVLDVYSNKKQVDLSLIYRDILQLAESTIVIIDNKIYSIAEKEFKEMDKTKIKELRIIKDEHSKSTIKNVIIINTK